MRKMRKGFTLVELLIIIAIIGVLAATMMVTATGSTATAKASTIANNVRACRTAALLYYQEHAADPGTCAAKTSDVLAAQIGTWADYSDGNIAYTVTTGKDTDTTKYTEWSIDVDFSADTADQAAIATALAKIKGFGKQGGAATVYASNYKFSVNLWTGKLTEISD